MFPSLLKFCFLSFPFVGMAMRQVLSSHNCRQSFNHKSCRLKAHFSINLLLDEMLVSLTVAREPQEQERVLQKLTDWRLKTIYEK